MPSGMLRGQRRLTLLPENKGVICNRGGLFCRITEEVLLNSATARIVFVLFSFII